MSDHLSGLFGAIQAARLHYGIYQFYKNDVDRPRYADTMNKYYWFFAPSIHAHFVAMIMSLATIYDERRDVVSIYKVIRAAKGMPGISKHALAEIKNRLKQIRPIMAKIFVLRHNVYAHMSENMNHEEAFKQADLTLNNLRDCIDQTAQLLQQLCKLLGALEQNIADSSKYDVRDLLNDLQNFQKHAGEGDKDTANPVVVTEG